jgi:hypothetical protein
LSTYRIGALRLSRTLKSRHYHRKKAYGVRYNRVLKALPTRSATSQKIRRYISRLKRRHRSLTLKSKSSIKAKVRGLIKGASRKVFKKTNLLMFRDQKRRRTKLGILFNAYLKQGGLSRRLRYTNLRPSSSKYIFSLFKYLRKKGAPSSAQFPYI